MGRREQRQVPFRLPEGMAKALTAVAEAEDRSVQFLLEEMVRDRILLGRGGPGGRIAEARRRQGTLGDAYFTAAEMDSGAFTAWLGDRLADGNNTLILAASGVGKTYPALRALRGLRDGRTAALRIAANDFALYEDLVDGWIAGPIATPLGETAYLPFAAGIEEPFRLLMDVAVDLPGCLADAMAATTLARGSVITDQYSGSANSLAKAMGLKDTRTLVRVLEAFRIVPVRARREGEEIYEVLRPLTEEEE